MVKANGHGPKRAILYARVSTEEQAKTGYSIPEQLRELRAYAVRERATGSSRRSWTTGTAVLTRIGLACGA